MAVRTAVLLLSLARCSLAAAAAPAAGAAAAGQKQEVGIMVVELDLQSGGEKVTKETLTNVFKELGAEPEKFKPVLDKHASGADEK